VDAPCFRKAQLIGDGR
jgi:hypothetical protein